MLKRIVLTLLLVLGLASAAEAIKYKGDLEADESVEFSEQSSTPSNAASGKRKLYFKDDGNPYQLDSAGNENPLMARGLKNVVINGNFDVWQRGTSFSTPSSNTYTADRWTVEYDGTIGAFTLSRQAFTLGQTDVPNEPAYFLRWDQTAAGSGSTLRQLTQKIEGVRTFAGVPVTVSLYLKCDAARTVSTRILQQFGSGGTPSGNVVVDTANHSCTTTWTKFTQTATVNSLSGKTIGTNGDDSLQINFVLPINVTMTIDIAQVQIEKGSVATEFERRPFALELVLCQRYYWKTYDLNTNPGTATSQGVSEFRLSGLNTAAHTLRGGIRFPVPMRGVPTVTLYSDSTGTSGKWRDNANSADVTATAVRISFISLSVEASGASSSEVFITGHIVAEAEL